MSHPGIRLVVLAVLAFLPQSLVAQLTITTGDSNWSIGRVEWGLSASGGTEPYTWSLAGGTPPTGLALRTDIPSWFIPGVSAGLIGVATTPGTFNFTLRVTDSLSATTTKDIAGTILGLVVTCDGEFADASVGAPYSKTITTAGASGGLPFALSSGSSLPPGLSLNTATGEIDGTPATPGDYNFAVDITDSIGTISRWFHVYVSPMRLTSAAALANGTQGTPYSHAIAVTGATGSVTYSLACCTPGWLSLDPNSGLMSGTPDSPGYWSFWVDIADSTGAHLRKHYHLGVVGTPPVLPGLAATRIDDFTIGEYSVWYLSVTGGTAPYSFSTSGTLPPGMTVQNVPDPRPFWNVPGAWLVGAPTALGSYTFMVTATDSSVPPVSTSREYTVRVSPMSYDQPPNPEFLVAYSQKLRVVGGSQPYTVVKTLGSLPAGLTMDPATLMITGTPTETGYFWIEFQVTDDAANTYRHVWHLYVQTTPSSAVDVQAGDLGQATVNQGFTWHLWAWGGSGTYTWTLESGSLPAGVSLSGSPGPYVVLSGTPTATGDHTFTLRAVDTADSANFAVRTFRMTVTPLNLAVNSSLPWGNAGSGYSTTLSVSGATGTVSWTIDPGSSLPPGMLLSSGGVLSGTPLSAGQYWFTLRATDSGTGSSAAWGFQVALYPAGTYPPLANSAGDLTTPIGRVAYPLGASGGDGVYTWSIDSGTLPLGVALRTDLPNGWTGVSAGLIGLATTPGTYNFVLRVTDGAANTATMPVTFRVLNLVFTTNWELPDGAQGVGYSQSIAGHGSGGALTFALEPGQTLPPGLELASNGQITGTPTVAALGHHNFNVRLTEGADSIVQNFRIYVSKLNITTPWNLLIGTQGTAYNQTITVTGGTGSYNLSVGCCVPNWLTWTPNAAAGTVTLTGTPDGPGYWQLQFNVTDATGAWARRDFALGAVGTPLTLPSIDTSLLEDLSIGEWRGAHIWISGGTPPYTWSVSSGTLPPGVAILPPSATLPGWPTAPLTLGGTPTAAGTYSFALTATDSAGQTVTRNFELRVSTLSRDGLPDATYGVPYSQKIYVYGGTPPPDSSFTLNNGVLPAGLTLGADGVVSGTPLEAGNPWFQPRITRGADELIQGLSVNVAKTPPTTVWINDYWNLGTILINAAWSRTFSAGGAAGFTWSHLSGTLPPGLSFSAAGVLSGTPTSNGTYTFTLQVADSANLAEVNARAFMLRVTAVSITGNWQLPYANVGTPYSHTLTATGGTITWAATPSYGLPPGLSLSAAGVLSGTPTASGAYNFNVTATDSVTGTSMTWNYNLSIYLAGAFPPLYINTGSSLGTWGIGPVEAELAAQGGDGTYSWSRISGTLPPGILVRGDRPPWFSAGSSGLSGVATTPGVYNFTLQVTSAGQTATRAFTVRVTGLAIKDGSLADGFVGQPYSYTLSNAGAEAVTWSLSPGNQLPPGLTLASNGVLSGDPTTAGNYNFSVRMTNGSTSVSRGFGVTVYAIRATHARRLPNATQNSEYTFHFTSAGGTGTVTWNADSTPNGLTLLPDGTLTGAPGQAGSWWFGVTATDSNAQFYKAWYHLTVVGVPPILPSMNTMWGSIGDLTLGSPDMIGFSMNGGTAPFTWTASGVPPGMSMRSGAEMYSWPDPAGGLLWGTPTATGTYNVTVSATDDSTPPITVSRTYAIKVTAMAHSGEDIPYGTRGQPYTATLRTIGGALPYTWSIFSGVLPYGLTLNPSTGVVSGTVLENVRQCPQVKVTDGGANTYTTTYCFDIGGGTTTINMNTGYDLGSATQNQYYSRTFNAGGAPTFVWSVESPSALPPGLTLSGGGLLSGKPTAQGVYEFLLRAEDSGNAANFGVQRFILNVTPLTVSSIMSGSWANVGSSFTLTPTVFGAEGTVTWNLAPNSLLPLGMTLGAGGLVSGTPTSAGRFNFSLVATDAVGGTSRTVSYTINVYPTGVNPPLNLSLGLGTLPVGPITTRLQASGGYPPYTYSYSPGADPISGVRVQNGQPLPTSFPSSATAGLLGVLTTPGVYSTSIRVTDSHSQVFDRALTFTVSPLMHLANDWLPRATVGAEYTFTFTASGGAAYSWVLQQNAVLPTGLTLDSNGTLHGIPTSAGTYNFSVQVLSGGDWLTGWFTLEVLPFAITTANILTATVSVPINVPLLADSPNTPITWSMNNGGLPNGFSLVSSPAKITGGTTTPTYSYFTLQATDSIGRTSLKNFSLTVLPTSPLPLVSDNGSLDDTVVGRTVAENDTSYQGVPPYTISANTPLPPGLVIVNNGATVCNSCDPGRVYLTGRPTEVDDYSFTLTQTDSALPTPSTTTFDVSLHVAPVSIEYENLPIPNANLVYNTAYSQPMLGIGGTGTYTWVAENAMPPGLSLSAGGTVFGTPAETGWWSTYVRITDGDDAFIRRNVYFYVSSGTAATLNIDVNANLGTISQGSSINRDLWASGSPLSTPGFTFSAVDPLPTGCAVLSGNAMPSGTSAPGRVTCVPTSAGTFTFRIRVQDTNGNFGVKTFTLRVTPNSILTASGTSGLYNAAMNQYFSQKLVAWGASQTWSYGAGLPSGMTLAADGTLSGTPSATGSYSFSACVKDASDLTVCRNYTLTVAGFSITSPGLIPVQAITGEPYPGYTFTAATDAGPYTSGNWSLAPGSSLPSGFALSSGGVLTGQRADEGIFNFTVQVTDGSTTFRKLFSFVVRNKYSMLTAGPSNLDTYRTLLPAFYQLTAAGGVPPYTWTLKPGSSLPPGLMLLSGSDLPANFAPISTVLAGMPTAPGVYPFTLLVTDAAGATVERTLTFRFSTLNAVSGMFLRNPTRNNYYEQALTAVGGMPPYNFRMLNGVLPPGFSLSSSGVISGTTTNKGYWQFMVEVTDNAGNKLQLSYGFTVQSDTPPSNPIDIGLPPLLTDISVGRPWWQSLNASGGAAPYTWTKESGTLPPGINLMTDGVLGGIPTTPGVYTFTLCAEDSTTPTARMGCKVSTVRVSAIQMYPRGFELFTNTSASLQVRAVGGTPPYTFSLPEINYYWMPNVPARNSLPLGLTFNPDGTITGTTAESGDYSFSVKVSDSAGDSFTTIVRMRVWRNGATVPLTIDSADDEVHLGGETMPGSLNSPYLQWLEPDEEKAPPWTAFSITSGSLPPGLVFIPANASHGPYLLGAPTAAGIYDYGARVTDSAGQWLDLIVRTQVSPLSLAPDALPGASVGSPYSVTFTPSGGTAPYSLVLDSGSDLPPGLAVSGMTLSGTPASPGLFNLSFVLRDSDGQEFPRFYSHFPVDSAITPLRALGASPTSIYVNLVSGSTPDAVPVNIDSGFASVDFTAGVAGIAGASLSLNSGTTPQSISLALPSGLSIGKHYAVIEIRSPQAPNSPISVLVVANVIAPPPCSYAVNPPTASLGSGAVPGSFNITTPGYCGWTATASQPWITITSASSGSGDGSLTYSLSSNPDTSSRTGTISVNGQTHGITQFGSSCAFTIDPSSLSVPAGGGDATAAVNASLGSCAWTAASNTPSWLHVGSSGGTGSGSVGVTIDGNTGASPRSGTATIAGLTFTVDQASAGCAVSLSAASASVPSNGVDSSVDVSTNGCGYSTIPGPSWITVTSGGSGPGPTGTVNYTVAPNSSTQSRSGLLVIGAQPYQIVQAGELCSFTISNDTPSFGSSGGSGVTTVTPNGSNCGWTAASGSSWLTINSGTKGTGSGQVNYTVASNSTTSDRAGSIIVAGQTVPVNQGATACSYDLRGASGSVPPAGGTGTVGVIAPTPCQWTTTSNAAWLSLTSSTGSGTSDAVFVAQPNPAGTERVGTLTVAGKTYTVTQPGAPCSYALASSSTNVGPTGVTASVAFTANQPGCSPAALSFANWIGVSTSFGGTAGSVTYTVAANPQGSARSGTIQLGDSTFKVNQTAAACAYSLNAYGANFGTAGGSGSVLASASASGCTPAVGASPELTLGTLSHDPNWIWTQPYMVPLFTSLNPWIRMLQVSMSGQIHSVKQTSW